jgi:multiple sugar transport system substrate-binding protein
VYKSDYSKAIDPVLTKFKKDNPNITLQTEAIANDDIRTKLLSAIAAKNLPDVAYVDGQNLAEFQSTGLLVPLDSYVNKWGQKSDFPDEVWKTVVFSNKVYGIPGDGDVRTLIYRKDLFAKAGISNPPSNWSELEADAKKLTTTDSSGKTVWGFALNAGDSEHTTMRSLPWIWDLGGNLVDSSGKATLNSDAVLKVVTFMNKLVNVDKVSPPNSYMNTKKEVANLINSGSAAMAIVGSWEWNSDASFLKNDTLKSNFASAPIPVPDDSKVKNSYTAAGYGTWVIFNQCKNKDAAWDWINLCTTTTHMVDIFKYGTGNLGLRKSVVKDPVFSENDAFKSFIEVIPYAKARPNSQYYDLLSSQYRGAVQKTLSGKATAQAALADAQKQAEAGMK